MADIDGQASEEESESNGKKLRERKKIKYNDHTENEENSLDKQYKHKIEKLAKSKKLKGFRAKEAMRAKMYRLCLSDEKKERSNKLAKERMVKYRAKNKESIKKKRPKVLTRKETKEEEESKAKMRAYWREKKQLSRAKESQEKKQIDKLKRQEKYKETKATKSLSKTKRANFGEENDDYKSGASTRKAISRCNERLPTTPKKWLRVVGGIIKRATPRKRKLLDESGLVLSPKTIRQIETNEEIVLGVKEFIKKNKTSRKMKHHRKNLISTILTNAKKTGFQINVRQNLGIQWRNLCNLSFIHEEKDMKKRSDALTEEEVKDVQDYYLDPTVSSELPTRKSVSKRTLISKSVMTKSTKSAYDIYCQQHEKKISLDKFRKLRPKHVLTADKTQLRQCLCEYCTNLELKLQCITSIPYRNVYDIVNDSLCPKQGKHHIMKCITRKCKECGTEKLKKKIPAICKDIVTWERWENRKIAHGKVEKVKKLLVTKSGTPNDFLDELLNEVSFMSLHLFTATWQYQQFSSIKENMPEGWVVLIEDFAENYRTFFQDEIQSAHWQYEQVTVHPSVTYYRCPEIGCEEVVAESIVCLSDDMKHDADAVHAFNTTINEHLTKKIKHIKHQVQFSDGCSAQYKSRTPFMDVSCGAEDYGFTVERNFFGSRHGKGPCDGLGAVIKQATRRAVERREATVQNAKDMYNLCCKTLSVTKGKNEKCCHKLRTFYLVSNINRSRSRNPVNAVQGTRGVHNVKGITHGMIETRNLSCFCKDCREGQFHKCENLKSGTIQPYKQHNFVMEGRGRKRQASGKIETDPSENKKARKVPKTREKTKNGSEKKPQNRLIETRNLPKPRENKKSGSEKKPKNRLIETRNLPKPRENKESGSEKKPQNRLIETRNLPKPRENKKSGSEKKSKTNYTFDSLTCSPPVIREEVFERMLEKLGTSNDFEELIAMCTQMNEDIMNFKYDINCDPLELVVMQGFSVDELAFDLAPGDITGSVVIPIKTCADGNCLPRCGSLFAFKHEKGHIEIRTRIIIELALNGHLYLNNDYLKRGTNLNKNLLHIYAMISDLYIPGIHLNDAVVARIYESEVLKCTKLNAYMGIWQIFALANVLKCPIMSCYPEFIKSEVRECLHRLVFPSHTTLETPAIAHVLWTSTRLDMTPLHWVPNHFVPLVGIDKPMKTRYKDKFDNPEEEVTRQPSSPGIEFFEKQQPDYTSTTIIPQLDNSTEDQLHHHVDENPKESTDTRLPSSPVIEVLDIHQHANTTTTIIPQLDNSTEDQLHHHVDENPKESTDTRHPSSPVIEVLDIHQHASTTTTIIPQLDNSTEDQPHHHVDENPKESTNTRHPSSPVIEVLDIHQHANTTTTIIPQLNNSTEDQLHHHVDENPKESTDTRLPSSPVIEVLDIHQHANTTTTIIPQLDNSTEDQLHHHVDENPKESTDTRLPSSPVMEVLDIHQHANATTTIIPQLDNSTEDQLHHHEDENPKESTDTRLLSSPVIEVLDIHQHANTTTTIIPQLDNSTEDQLHHHVDENPKESTDTRLPSSPVIEVLDIHQHANTTTTIIPQLDNSSEDQLHHHVDENPKESTDTRLLSSPVIEVLDIHQHANTTTTIIPQLDNSTEDQLHHHVDENPKEYTDTRHPSSPVIGPQQQLNGFDRISVGTYVSIQHGKDVLPAVITKLEDDYFWIQYYRSVKKGKYIQQPKQFTAYKSDLISILQPPELVHESRSRSSYCFKESFE